MKKRNVIIIAGIILVIIVAIFGITKLIGNSRNNSEKELAELKEQKIQLETRKNEVFIEDGFSEEYYRISEELKDVNRKIQENEITSGPPTIFFTMFGLVFILIFGSAVVTIFRSMSMHRTIAKTATTVINNQTTNDNSEEIEKMASILGKVATDMAINMNPEYKSLKCPNCGAALTDDVEVCEYCDAPLIKVAASKK